MDNFQALLDELNALNEKLDAYNRAYIPHRVQHPYMDHIHNALYDHANRMSDGETKDMVHDIRLHLLDSTFNDVLDMPWDTRQVILEAMNTYGHCDQDDERQYIVWKLIASVQ